MRRGKSTIQIADPSSEDRFYELLSRSGAAITRLEQAIDSLHEVAEEQDDLLAHVEGEVARLTTLQARIDKARQDNDRVIESVRGLLG